MQLEKERGSKRLRWEQRDVAHEVRFAHLHTQAFLNDLFRSRLGLSRRQKMPHQTHYVYTCSSSLDDAAQIENHPSNPRRNKELNHQKSSCSLYTVLKSHFLPPFSFLPPESWAEKGTGHNSAIVHHWSSFRNQEKSSSCDESLCQGRKELHENFKLKVKRCCFPNKI